jgi:uncharacterized protein (TIGR02145 family)
VVGSVSSNVTVTVGASVDATGAESNTISFVGLKITYPSTLNIGGGSKINAVGDIQYTRTFDTNNYTAELLSVAWSLSANNVSSITSQTSESATVNVTAVSASAVVVTLTCVATFTNSHTVTGTKEITIKEPFAYTAVDLGLPSGKLWANANVGAESVEEAGLYFAWGETEGYADANERNAALGRTDGFSQNAYNAAGASSISANLTLEQDAARQNMLGDWRMPTNAEFQELYNNTDKEWTSINSVNGWKFFNKEDHSKWIFMPAVGSYYGTSRNNYGSNGFYWSATYNSSSNAYYLDFYSSSVSTNLYSRYFGFPVRAVA